MNTNVLTMNNSWLGCEQRLQVTGIAEEDVLTSEKYPNTYPNDKDIECTYYFTSTGDPFILIVLDGDNELDSTKASLRVVLWNIIF